MCMYVCVYICPKTRSKPIDSFIFRCRRYSFYMCFAVCHVIRPFSDPVFDWKLQCCMCLALPSAVPDIFGYAHILSLLFILLNVNSLFSVWGMQRPLLLDFCFIVAFWVNSFRTVCIVSLIDTLIPKARLSSFCTRASGTHIHVWNAHACTLFLLIVLV